MLRLYITMLLLFLLTRLCVAAERDVSLSAAGPGDTIGAPPSERVTRFYDSLESKSTRRTVPRLIYRSIFIRGRRDTLGRDRVVDESKRFEPYAGKRIGRIILERGNVFDPDGNKLERFGNRIHVVTRERTIRRDLFFKPGDPLDPDELAKNQQFLRSRSYIAEARIEAVPDPSDSTLVDLVVQTRDSWTISADLSLNINGRTGVELYDANLLGYGNRLSVGTNFDWKNGTYGGNRFEYGIPNIFGTFFDAEFIVGRRFEYSDLGFTVKKKFLLPTDYELGISYQDKAEPYYMLFQDSTMRTAGRFLDVWGGRSRYIRPFRNSIYFTGRYSRWTYDIRPEVRPDYNPVFHNSQRVLAGIGIYREKFYSATMVYGFGLKEYLAAGYKAELTGGYIWGEFSHDWYLGMHFSKGGFFNAGYLMGGFTLGSYISPSSGMWYRSGVDFELRYFTPLLVSGRSRIRQFINLSYTQGWNRDTGCDELIEFTEDRGPNALDEKIVGLNRAVLNTETVLFTPWQPYGFKIAFYGFADFALLGRESNIFRNDFFNTIGLGVRIKNERLVFNTIQIRFGVALGKGGFRKAEYFNISNQRRPEQYRYLPEAPEVVPFR